jgi:hypothetical protein
LILFCLLVVEAASQSKRTLTVVLGRSYTSLRYNQTSIYRLRPVGAKLRQTKLRFYGYYVSYGHKKNNPNIKLLCLLLVEAASQSKRTLTIVLGRSYTSLRYNQTSIYKLRPDGDCPLSMLSKDPKLIIVLKTCISGFLSVPKSNGKPIRLCKGSYCV